MTAKILVVDDEQDLSLLIRQKFRRQIRDEVYEFFFAHDGIDALELLGQHNDVDMVLSDINMPRMDGLTLLGKVGEVSAIAKVVMVTAYGDMKNIRAAMNQGAFDFLIKPIDFQDLEATIAKTLKQVEQTRKSMQSLEENTLLRDFVNRSVVDLLMRLKQREDLAPTSSIHATVVFIDVYGFTVMTEQHTARDVVAILNSYLESITREVLARNGAVDKFMGDCTMAVFRGDGHLDRAIDACLAIRAAATEKERFPHVAIGLCAGEMVAGPIGAESVSLVSATVLGDVVNTAAKLQTSAGKDQILVDQSLADLIRSTYLCERVGTMAMHRIGDSMATYNIVKKLP